MNRSPSLAKLERRIRTQLHDHLHTLGFRRDKSGQWCPPAATKDAIRAMHRLQRLERLQNADRFLMSRAHKLLDFFASGCDVNPRKISPRIQQIYADTKESELFRLATLTWSVPVSQGYGRRMRFLVWDDSNGKILGIFALGDPVFNLRVRDDIIGWNSRQRADRLVHTMDAYVLGAMPPYNQLLAGKLVACLVRTKDVRDHFTRKYRKAEGIISGQKKRPSLALVTTSSALGRSSIYNRLTLKSIPYFVPVGYSEGWGHFHVPTGLFAEMRRYLDARDHSYANGHEFGHGPNWRLRTIRAALTLLGEDPDLLRHGIGRQIFLSHVAANAESFLRGDSARPVYRRLLSVEEVGRQALDRWVIPRAERRPEFKEWRREDLWNRIRAADGPTEVV